ncbi:MULTISPECIES: HEAT repeat domain-containing protein [unclassified Dehalobacter]|uniref:HEAT repeat domain-containing protein n=1 Tax=Dehalobacter TaxID=56112 RepID=UPI0003109FB4|nr:MULTISPECIES: HEAT repeat domain-containing protein [unclassified Dehalobacter]
MKVAQDFSLSKMLNMTDEFYTTRIQPLMYNYIKDRKYFQRNAAIALGNLGESSAIPDLGIAMDDPEELVRSYAAWALGKIGGNAAKRILEKNHQKQTSEAVQKEIDSALEKMK